MGRKERCGNRIRGYGQRKLSAAGRAAIVAALKKRWAAKKAGLVVVKKAVAKKTAPRKAGAKKAAANDKAAA